VDEDYSAYVSARWPALVRSAVMLGCSRQDAEDLVQTALIRCYRSWDKVSKASDVDAYVYRVLVNSWAKSRRRRWWGEQPSEDVSGTAETPDAHLWVETADSVQRALSTLSPAHRAVVVLRFFVDLTDHQTADVLRIPVGTVKSRLSRAVRSLATNPHLVDLTSGSPPYEP
jgi:RNA polymerase sigma-70 factor (sigma-E family)